MKQRLALIVVFLLVLSAGAGACSEEISSSTETSSTVSETSVIQTVSPSPTPVPTVAITPTPAPSSVFIPREELPDGRILPTGYFAVLKGEGAMYDVYNDLGKLAYSFKYTDTWGAINSPAGLYMEEELWQRGFRDTSALADSQIVRAYSHGFYTMDELSGATTVKLYNRSGKLLTSLEVPVGLYSASVSAVGNETAVAYVDYENSQTTMLLVAQNGKVIKTVESPVSYFGWLGGRYLAYNDAIYDTSGRIIVESTDEGSIEFNDLWVSGEEGCFMILIGDYYKAGGIVWDARTLQPVPDDTARADGTLISGVTYHVDGISCQESRSRQSDWQSVAVGYEGNRIAIKTSTESYVFECGGDKFSGMNQTQLMLEGDNGRRVISLATGFEIYRLGAADVSYEFADDYLIVRTTTYDAKKGKQEGFYIVDKDGNVRAVSAVSQARPSASDCMLLTRGPYIGIADLNGDWLIKYLNYEMMRDAPAISY